MTLSARSFGLAGGILCAAALFVLTWIADGTGYSFLFLSAIANIYPGYTISPLGSVIGAAYGFVDAFVGLYLFAVLYNWLEGRKQY